MRIQEQNDRKVPKTQIVGALDIHDKVAGLYPSNLLYEGIGQLCWKEDIGLENETILDELWQQKLVGLSKNKW